MFLLLLFLTFKNQLEFDESSLYLETGEKH